MRGHPRLTQEETAELQERVYKLSRELRSIEAVLMTRFGYCGPLRHAVEHALRGLSNLHSRLGDILDKFD